MASLEDIIDDIEKFSEVSFSRSSGPGGQNVNKVNTSVQLSMDIERFTCLTVAETERLRNKLSSRINIDGQLFVRAQQQRSQLKNRQFALNRMAELVLDSIKKTKSRKKTRASKAAQEKRLHEKKRRADIKKLRKLPE